MEGKDAENTDAGDGEAGHLNAIGIECGDDQYRDDVVDDGERQQEHAHIDGNSSPQQRKDADGKGDVRCGRYRPAAASNRIAVEAQVDQGRDDDAAACRDQGQHGLVDPAQRAFVDLAPDFHADDQEEQGHQRVVDPEMQRLREDVFAQSDRDRQVPEGVIAVSERRVRPHQRGGGRKHKHGAAGGFDTKKTLKGRERLFGKALGSRDVVNYRWVVHRAHAFRVAARPSLDLSLR